VGVAEHTGQCGLNDRVVEEVTLKLLHEPQILAGRRSVQGARVG
jgi:hypothetical protein